MSETWKDDLVRVKALVQAWDADAQVLPKEVATDEAHRYRESFRSFTYKGFSKELDTFIASNDKSNWKAIGGFLRASPVQIGHPPVLFPLVRFFVRVIDGHVELMVRLATFFINFTENEIDQSASGAIDAHGWRFETADVPGGHAGDGTTEAFHHYPHAQPITAWSLKGKGLFPPNRDVPHPHEKRLVASMWNESRPAFPLPCDSPVGVVVAAMTTLYGSVRTKRILEKTPNDQYLQRDITAVIRH